MSKNILFAEDQKVMKIELEDLAATAEYQGIKKHEVPHHELFSKLMTDLSDRGYEAKLDELYISKSGVIFPTQREVDNKGYLTSINDIRGIIVQNCIGKINMKGQGLSDAKSNQQIAVAFTKQGMSMSMGQGISICANLNIFGGQMISNYGASQVPFMRMLDIMASWIQNMRKLRVRDLTILDTLQNVNIDPVHEVDEVVGNLHRLCEMNKKETQIVSPLTHSRIHDLQRGMIEYAGNLTTAYDFYQAATEVSTHQQVLENRLPNTADLGSYFQSRYSAVVDVELDEVIASTDLT